MLNNSDSLIIYGDIIIYYEMFNDCKLLANYEVEYLDEFRFDNSSQCCRLFSSISNFQFISFYYLFDSLFK